MSSAMELDCSGYRAEVAVLNGDRAPSGKRSRASFEDSDLDVVMTTPPAPTPPVARGCPRAVRLAPLPSRSRSLLATSNNRPVVASVCPPAPRPVRAARPGPLARSGKCPDLFARKGRSFPVRVPSPAPATTTTPMESEAPARRWPAILLSASAAMISALWGTLRPGPACSTATEIVAVATDGSARKRRALAITTTLPGTWPPSPALPTPPESRPSSAQEARQQEMAIRATTSTSSLPGAYPDVASPSPRAASPAPPSPSPSPPPQPQVTVAKKRTEPFRSKLRDNATRLGNAVGFGSASYKLRHAERQQQRSPKAPEPTAVKKAYNTGRHIWKPLYPRLTKKNAEELAAHERQIKDDQVDGLILRAREAQLGSPEERQLKQTLKDNYEQRKAAEKAEQLRKEQEALEAKQAAEEAAFQETVRIVEQEKLEAEYQEKLLREAEIAARNQAEQESALITKQKLIRDLDPKWKQRVDAALATKSNSAVLAVGPDGNELTRNTFERILPSQGSSGTKAWLNDESINGWFSGIVAAKNEQTGWKTGTNKVPAIEAYNSGWYTTYKNSGISKLSRWSKRKHIGGQKLLGAEKIFFPINTGAHWTLLIISPTARNLEFLDSMGGSSAPWFKIAREWLEMELGSTYTASDWTELDSASSQQSNFSDCGVFTCINALASAKNRPFSDVRANNMQQARELMAAVLLNGGFTGDFEL